MGPGRRKAKRSYPGPQIEVEDNVDHRVHQRSIGYEETAGITHSCADIEKGVPSSNGIAQGVGSRGHCIGGRHKEQHGRNSSNVRRDGQQRYSSASIGFT
jgi:hypothetical protein